MKKRNDKDTKRRLALQKQNAREEKRIAKYGSGSVAVIAQDVNRRFVAAFLALAVVLSSLFISVYLIVAADNEEPSITNANLTPLVVEQNGLHLEKFLTVADDSTYTLNLKAYATGTTKEITEQVPTDFILVLDQSGSMSTVDMPQEYDEGTEADWDISQSTTEPTARYYKDEETGKYYRVYRKRGTMYEYHAPDTVYSGDLTNNLRWFSSDRTQTQTSYSQYYYRPSDGGTTLPSSDISDSNFYPLKITAKGEELYYGIKLSYVGADGTQRFLQYPDNPIYKSPGGGTLKDGDTYWLGPVPLFYSAINKAVKTYSSVMGDGNSAYTYATVLGINTGMYVHQAMYTRHNGYNQLCYKNDEGEEVTLIKATYCSTEDDNGDVTPYGGKGGTQGNQTSKTKAYWPGKLYEAKDGSVVSRLQALNTSLTDFVNHIAAQEDYFGPVDHRIAIVGFSSENNSSYTYNNTELLTGVEVDSSVTMPNSGFSLDGYRHDGIQYNETLSDTVYQNTLLSTTNAEELSKLRAAVDYVTAYGGTQPEYGFRMAKKIIDARGETTNYSKKSDGTVEKRRTVVIYFTDGRPGNYVDMSNYSTYSNQYDEANDVVAAAFALKPETTIYSIGVFGESDGNPLMYYNGRSSSNKDGFSTPKDAKNSVYSEKDFDPLLAEVRAGCSSYTPWQTTYYRYPYRNYFFRKCAAGTYGYPDTADDTISDYMRTVSSEYPNAELFVDQSWNSSSSETYMSMIERVRKDQDNSGRYYFMASDQRSLTEVFDSISSEVTNPGSTINLNNDNTYMMDEISGNFSRSSESRTTVQTVSAEKASNDSEVTFGQDYQKIKNADTWNGNVLKISGFDYTEHYVAPNAPDGRALIVTITGLLPKGVNDVLESNVSENSGIFTKNLQETTQYDLLLAFPMPSISRHSYTLNCDRTESKFTVSTKLVLASNPTAKVNPTDAALANVIVVSPNGTREKYPDTIDATRTFSNVQNGQTFYYENVPDGYQVQTSITATDSAYTYTWTELGGSGKTLSTTDAKSVVSNYEDTTYHITSVANNRTVTIRNITVGEYADKDREFPITVTLTKDGSAATDFNETINGVTFTNGVATIPMKDGDSISITLPTGYGLSVADNSNPPAYSNITYKLDDGDFGASPIRTDTNDDRTIVVKHTRDEVTDTGVLEQTNPLSLVMYVLAGALAIAAGGTAYYTKRKKEEN